MKNVCRACSGSEIDSGAGHPACREGNGAHRYARLVHYGDQVYVLIAGASELAVEDGRPHWIGYEASADLVQTARVDAGKQDAVLVEFRQSRVRLPPPIPVYILSAEQNRIEVRVGGASVHRQGSGVWSFPAPLRGLTRFIRRPT
jgi:hypothetical protein